MNPRCWQIALLLVATIVALSTLSGCGPGAADQPSNPGETIFRQFEGAYPIQVVCTTGPIADMLRNLGGDHLAVNGLMGPGVDPHLYRAAPADVRALQEADLIVYNGLHLEGRMQDIFERLSRTRAVIAVTEDLAAGQDARLLKPPEFEGYYDPHVWHDPTLWSECVRYVAERLADLDPTHGSDYAQQAERYLADLAEADTYCRERIESIPANRRVLVTAHDAFAYFSRAYGMETAALKGISTDEEVSIGRMDEVIKLLVERRVPAVFVESAVAPRIVKALVAPCAARGHTVAIGGELYADALGPQISGADTYLGMFKANVDTIVLGLNPDGDQE